MHESRHLWITSSHWLFELAHTKVYTGIDMNSCTYILKLGVLLQHILTDFLSVATFIQLPSNISSEVCVTVIVALANI